jgi:hypothetical protein
MLLRQQLMHFPLTAGQILLAAFTVDVPALATDVANNINTRLVA